MIPVLVITFVVGLMVSFLLSGMEAGVFALSPLRIRQRMREGSKRAATLNSYLAHPEDFLWTILVGNTLSNVAVVSLCVFGAWRVLEPWPLAYVVVLLSLGVLFYSFFELLPKMLFRLYPNRLCLAMVTPFRLVHWLLRPVVRLMALFSHLLLRFSGGRRFTGHLFGSRDELRVVMQESSEGFTADERTMINRVLELQNYTLAHILIPMNRVTSVSPETSAERILEISRETNFSRLPVRRREGEKVVTVGIVSLRSMLYREDFTPAKPAAELLKPALFLEQHTRLEPALRQMQRTGQRMVIVIGPSGQEAGIATLQDVLKIIFGEVRL